jgi:hypothetical protein
MKTGIRISLIIFLGLFWASAIFAKSDAKQWERKVLADANAIHTLLQENYPAIHLKDSQAMVWLESGYQQLLAEAATVKSRQGWYFSIKRYVDGFQDGLLRLHEIDFPAKWPGFWVEDKGNGVEVVAHDQNHRWKALPPLGARIVSCDGRSIGSWLRASASLQGNHLGRADYYASKLFWFQDNPYQALPKRCILSIAGTTMHFSLYYKLAWVDDVTLLRKYTHPGVGKLGSREIKPHQYWIQLPKLAINDLRSSEDFGKLFAKAKADKELRALVLDLRHYREEPVADIQKVVNYFLPQTWIRNFSDYPSNKTLKMAFAVSKQTYKKYQPDLLKFKTTEINPDLDVERLLRGIKWSKQRKRKLLVLARPLRQTALPKIQEGEDASRKMSKVQIVVITDRYCQGNCWRFLRALKVMPSVLHVGEAPMRWNRYAVPLSFKLGANLTIDIPNAAWLNRLSGRRHSIDPQVYYPQDIENTPALTAWVQKLMKQRAWSIKLPKV